MFVLTHLSFQTKRPHHFVETKFFVLVTFTNPKYGTKTESAGVPESAKWMSIDQATTVHVPKWHGVSVSHNINTGPGSSKSFYPVITSGSIFRVKGAGV
jgi:hypothetical protein